ncbi:MAG: hypothetical protein M0026_14585 [Nocardiopsaceae bacterium]|nr:hypothetical protein [Nocardiopsaceae bacterium]
MGYFPTAGKALSRPGKEALKHVVMGYFPKIGAIQGRRKIHFMIEFYFLRSFTGWGCDVGLIVGRGGAQRFAPEGPLP